MNADEIEKAKEIVRTLRDAERNTELDCEINELRPTLTQAADLIENLTAQLTDYHHMEQLVDGKMAENQRLRKINEKLQSQLTESQRKGRDARNELCNKCGRYHEAHKGTCGGCRWKE